MENGTQVFGNNMYKLINFSASPHNMIISYSQGQAPSVFFGTTDLLSSYRDPFAENYYFKFAGTGIRMKLTELAYKVRHIFINFRPDHYYIDRGLAINTNELRRKLHGKILLLNQVKKLTEKHRKHFIE